VEASCPPLSNDSSLEPNGVLVRKRGRLTDNLASILLFRVLLSIQSIHPIVMAYMLGAKEIMPMLVASFVGCASGFFPSPAFLNGRSLTFFT